MSLTAASADAGFSITISGGLVMRLRVTHHKLRLHMRFNKNKEVKLGKQQLTSVFSRTESNVGGDETETKKKGLTKANVKRKRGTTAYLPCRCHKNILESLSTTAAPPLKERKPRRVACSSPSPSSSPTAFPYLHYSAK